MSNNTSATTLLQAWRDGDRTALDRLVPLVYSELRRMAGACLRNEHTAQTLEPTALVHEAYLRLVGTSDPDFNNRAHFLAIAARVMRQILVGRARARNADKRSAGVRVPLDEDLMLTGKRASLVLALDDALSELDRQDPEKAKILELKYFGGLTAEDSAALLDVSVHKINRQMRLAQAWLRRELEAASCNAEAQV
ncbi:MAG TPA: ECF-type sigma factor [Bryobacteraceae bacterium]|nr:ECF-type sigma factor [Bryobacteraceae bacterium]